MGRPKARAGRPKLPAGSARQKSVSVRFTPAEFARMSAAVKGPVGPAMRRIALAWARHKDKAPPPMTEEELVTHRLRGTMQIAREVAAVGRNLNQVARALNRGDRPAVEEIVQAVRAAAESVEDAKRKLEQWTVADLPPETLE